MLAWGQDLLGVRSAAVLTHGSLQALGDSFLLELAPGKKERRRDGHAAWHSLPIAF